MSIDLTKLVGKKSYLVPIKVEDLCDEVLKHLKLHDSTWKIARQHSKSAVFNLDWKSLFIQATLMGEGKQETAKNIAKASERYEADPFASKKDAMEAIVGTTPAEIAYIVTQERVDGSIVVATCKSLVYETITRGYQHSETDLLGAKSDCEDYLDEIFIGGLSGKEIQEKKEPCRWELLINDTHTRQITERIFEMFDKATTCILFLGWFGTECIPQLKKLKEAGLTVKAITHKPSERKAPVSEEIQKGYSELVTLLGLNNVSVNSLVHGRAVIVDNKALVGSMDLNAFSLSGEHIEFAIYTEDPSAVRSLRAYFEKLFKPLKESSS